MYYDLVYNSLNAAARRALEAMMKGYEYQTDFAKKYVAQGRTEGRTEEAAHALLAVLRARGFTVPDAVHEAADVRLKVPMRPGLRSLNVALAGAIVLAEALRQTGGLPAAVAA